MAYAAAGKLIMATLLGVTPENYSDVRAGAARRKIEAITARLTRTAQVWVNRYIKQSYREELIVSRNRLAIIGAEKKWNFDPKAHSRAIRKLCLAVFKDLFKANQSISRITGQYLTLVAEGARGIKELHAFTLMENEKQRIGDLVQDASEEGLSRNTLRHRIMDYLQSRLEGERFITINDRKYRMAKYIELVARTRLREAATEATLKAAEEYDHDLVEIPRKGGSCKDCVDIEGQVYSISGRDPEYPPLTPDITPPIHPHCEHYIRVVSRTILGATS